MVFHQALLRGKGPRSETPQSLVMRGLPIQVSPGARDL